MIATLLLSQDLRQNLFLPSLNLKMVNKNNKTNNKREKSQNTEELESQVPLQQYNLRVTCPPLFQSDIHLPPTKCKHTCTAFFPAGKSYQSNLY